jgi:glucosamine-6-phosphate deaminase
MNVALTPYTRYVATSGWFVVKETTDSSLSLRIEQSNARKVNMETTKDMVASLTAGKMKLKIYPSKRAAGEAAALAVTEELRRLDQLRDQIGVIFATGAAQFDTLEFLTSTPGLPWKKVRGFHLDEYVGLTEDHPASFRNFLRQRLTQRVDMGAFFEMDGTAPDLEAVCREYIKELHVAEPQLCLLGIGENGHIAFNEPAEADFHDPLEMKIVTLDLMCRQQQAAEGWFPTWQEAPERALTLTIPTVFRVPKLIASVPGPRKAQVVRRTVNDPISTACPSTLLRTHPDVTVYLDTDSAAEL